MKRCLLVLCLWLAACATVPEHFNKPRIGVADITLKEMGLLEQRFELTLRVQNPNNVSIPLEGLDVTLAIDGKTLAKGVTRQHVTLPALGETTVKVDVSANLAALFDVWRAAQHGTPYKLFGRFFLPLRPDGEQFEYVGELPALKFIFAPPEQAPSTQQF